MLGCRYVSRARFVEFYQVKRYWCHDTLVSDSSIL